MGLLSGGSDTFFATDPVQSSTLLCFNAGIRLRFDKMRLANRHLLTAVGLSFLIVFKRSVMID